MGRYCILGGAIGVVLSSGFSLMSHAQIVGDETLGVEKSVVTPNVLIRGATGNLINGGAIRSTSLFHSFSQFDIQEGQRIYFANPTGVEYIFSRITGTNISRIMGTLGVDGNANLFFLNSNGILFGDSARLDIAGSFVASTANRLIFSSGQEFSLTNPQALPLLIINVPSGLQFQYSDDSSSGVIANLGNLFVGQDLTFAASNLDLQGQIQTGRDLFLKAQNTIRIRDTETFPFVAQSSRNLTLQANKSIDILTLNHPKTSIVSGYDFRLISDGQISTNAHFISNGNFSISNLLGSPTAFTSLYGVIISASGDVRFGDYIGTSIKVESMGSIIGGNIRTVERVDINTPKTTVESGFSANSQDVILRSGALSSFSSNLPQFNSQFTDFLITSLPLKQVKHTSSNIRVGNINTSNVSDQIENGNTKNAGAITLVASGNIQAGNLNSQSGSGFGSAGNGGRISLVSFNGGIIAGDINSESSVSPFFSFGGSTGNGGAINLFAGNGNILVGDIRSSSTSLQSTGFGGDINIYTTIGDISTDWLTSASVSILNNANNGGAINIMTNSGDISTKRISSESFSVTGNAASGGAINITSNNGSVSVGDVTSISLSDYRNANSGGEISLIAKRGNIMVGDLISLSFANLGNSGNSGNIYLSATEGNIIGNTSAVLAAISVSNAQRSGVGGNVTLEVQGVVSDFDVLTLSSSANSGMFYLTGSNLLVSNLRIITSKQLKLDIPGTREIVVNTEDVGKSGDVVIKGVKGIKFDNSQIKSDTKSSEPAGDVNIHSAGSIIFNDSFVLSSTSSIGSAGSINVVAGQGITITGLTSGLFAQTDNQGKAGTITLSSPQLTLQQGAKISTTTTGDGKAGDININVRDQLLLTGTNTGLFADTSPNSIGKGGSIKIEPSAVFIRDGARIAVDNQGSGIGGNIKLQLNKLLLDNYSSITAETISSKGGDIIVDVRDFLLLRRNSSISATAGGNQSTGDGGNIIIYAPLIVTIPNENSDIFANAFTGSGGRVEIYTQGIYGTTFRPRLTPISDITASSDFGSQGIVTFNLPGIDINRGLTELPSIPSDATKLMSQNLCNVRSSQSSQFIVTGRGGLPDSPNEPLTSETFWEDTRLLGISEQPQAISSVSPSPRPPTAPNTIIEAQGWFRSDSGKIHFVAAASNPSPAAFSMSQPHCHSSPQKEITP